MLTYVLVTKIFDHLNMCKISLLMWMLLPMPRLDYRSSYTPDKLTTTQPHTPKHTHMYSLTIAGVAKLNLSTFTHISCTTI